MDRYRANPKANNKNPSTAAATPGGFDTLYASLFGSGDRQNFSANPATAASANESLYPSSPYQIPTSTQMHSGGLGQTPSGLSYPSHSSDKWHPSRKSPTPPQHHEEPYSIGPFDSIWSMKSSEMAGASAGVQHQKKAGNFFSETTAASGYSDSQAPMSATNGLSFGGYDQHTYGHNDVGFHGDSGRIATPGYSWSPYDGVNDANVTGLRDWQWNQGASVPSEHWQSSGPEIDGNIENHTVNEWELHNDELEKKNREEDMKGRQERKGWKKKMLNHPEYGPDGSVHVHKQKSHASSHVKTTLNDKVVASFLEKYKDPAPLIPDSSLVGTGDEVRKSQFTSERVEELGRVCGESGSLQQVGLSPVDDLEAAVIGQATDGGCHIPGKSPSPEPERRDPMEDHQETTSNVDSSDLVDRMEGREVRSLSDPVTVQEAQQSSSVQSGTVSRKALSNGKIRPGKRKPKLPRDKRRSMSQAERSETISSRKQRVQIETKEQAESIENNTHLDAKRAGVTPNPPSTSLSSISSEHIVQSSIPTDSSQSIPDNRGKDPLLVSKAHVANSQALCQEAPLRDHGSAIQGCCLKSSICDECACSTTCESKIDAPFGKLSPSVTIKENTRIEKDDISLDLSYDKATHASEKSYVSSKSSKKNDASSFRVNDLSTHEKDMCSGHRTQRKNSAGTKNVQQQTMQTAPLDNPTQSQKDNLDSSTHVTDTVVGKSQNVGKKDIIEGLRPIPVQNRFEIDSNCTKKNSKLTDEMKLGNSTNLSAATGSSNQGNDKSASGQIQGQEKKNTKDDGLFFDPKRIFGGQKTIKTASQKMKGEAEKSSNSSPAERIPKNNHSADTLNYQTKTEKVHVHASESKQCGVLPNRPTEEQPANLTKSVISSMNEGMVNGTVPSKDLPPHRAQTVPSSAKDALASKASAMKAEPMSSQCHSDQSKQPASPTDPRPSRMYSYKKDDKTGVLRRSSDPKVEEATKHQSQRRDSSGTQSSSDEVKGERRCSGDSHMDGFHHPFGCSAQCYRRSSSPSSSRSCSNSRPASSGVHQSTGSSTSSEKKTYVFPQSEKSFKEKASETNDFAKLREGLKNSWLSKEKEKQRQERVQKEHIEKVRQQEQHEQRRRHDMQDQRKQEEKQDQRKQQKQQASASHAKGPTRATYSKPRSPEQESNDKRPGISKDRPGQGTSTHQPRRPWPTRPEERPHTASQEDSTEDSDLEEDLARGITDEWWFTLGKKLCNGVMWFILFTLLLCLVILSFVLAFLRDTCKFAYHRGWDLWLWYTEKPPQDDEFFNSHRSSQRSDRRETGDGSGFFGFGRSQDDEFFGSHRSYEGDSSSWFSGSRRSNQRETGAGGSGRGNWSHTRANGPSSSSQQGARAKQPRKKQTQNIELPSTEHAAIHRLLGCDPGKYYEVVGVAEDASEDDIKKFYRKQCMLVHPDKTDQPQANEAFQILQKAYAILSDPAKRNEYDFELDYKEDLEDKVTDLLNKMAEMANSMPCGVCERSHKRYKTDLPVHAARYCATHNTRHPVRDGDLWKETASFGFKIYVFLCNDHTVYDVTEWAACQSLDWVEANSCRLLCKVKRAGKSSQQRQQQPPRYEEMFDNIFGPGAFRQFHSSANQQGHHGNAHQSSGGGRGGHSHGQQGGGSRNRGIKKSRKKKK